MDSRIFEGIHGFTRPAGYAAKPYVSVAGSVSGFGCSTCFGIATRFNIFVLTPPSLNAFRSFVRNSDGTSQTHLLVTCRPSVFTVIDAIANGLGW